jgi:hypothetical protein
MNGYQAELCAHLQLRIADLIGQVERLFLEPSGLLELPHLRL